ncbi:MAG: hypothetical protein IJ728_04515 [Selenomonadaceae bacterium]|nr:hypothetical protein [Selenomonadaceae bacterium]
MNDYITRMKKPNHNIYDLNDFIYKVMIILCVSLWILLFFDVQIRHLSTFNQLSIWIAIPLIVTFVTFMIQRKEKNNIIPYCRKEDFKFLGLYDLKDSNLDNRDDILKRDEEVEYMHQILEETILPQSSVKQALCLTGPSGCGKSIILNFFKHTYKDKYKIFDFSGDYHEFEVHMASELGTNIDKNMSEITFDGKVVFILDQFERFFFLSKNEQKKIQEIIRYLCKKNTGFIISLREEYLADFLKRFDMNNLLSEDKEQVVIKSGILKKMISVIEKKSDMLFIAHSIMRSPKKNVWKEHNIKNNETIHLESHDRVIMEKMGATLLYCQNQNEMTVQRNGTTENLSILEGKCKKLFGEEMGSLLFNKHTNDPLIEQQIIFHMAEFNQKVLLYPEEKLHSFIEKNNNELLDQYFDHQLASCDNYFHASRLLYLLSQARTHHLSLKTQDLENYLFPNLFEKKGHEQLMNTIQQLENIQLIRKNTKGSTLEYEIAHDFIASTFLNYCSTNMDRNVKGALDLFISECMDDRRNTSFKEKISHRKDICEQHFYRNVYYFTMAFMVITSLVQHFVFNPWTTIWNDLNPYGDYITTFPLFITMLSAVYLYYMYDKTVKYYRGEKVRLVKILYILFAIFASMAVFAYPHFLFFDGIGLAISTLNIALLLDQRYRQTCRNELLAYGAKSFMIGMVFAFAHIFYFLFNRQFNDVLIFSEFTMFTTLVAYGFFVHMTQDFLYARMSDSASEKV